VDIWRAVLRPLERRASPGAKRSRSHRAPARIPKRTATSPHARRIDSTPRLDSGAALSSARRARPDFRVSRTRPGTLVLAFVFTAAWFLINLQRLTPLDALPFLWMWLMLWIAISILAQVVARLVARPTSRHR
jgi:hypothetical protein